MAFGIKLNVLTADGWNLAVRDSLKLKLESFFDVRRLGDAVFFCAYNRFAIRIICNGENADAENGNGTRKQNS